MDREPAVTMVHMETNPVRMLLGAQYSITGSLITAAGAGSVDVCG